MPLLYRWEWKGAGTNVKVRNTQNKWCDHFTKIRFIVIINESDNRVGSYFNY